MRILLSASLLLLAANVEARRLGEIDFEPCTLAPPSVPLSVDAQCATVSVAENPADPDGRSIDLALAWIPARDEAEPDPVFMLAGGPGQSARDSYPLLQTAFRDIRRKRHVLLLDQRGTGASNPLVCRTEEGDPALMEGLREDTPEALRDFAARCRDELSAQSDLRFYRTTDAVTDLDTVRQLIGAEQINLVGISYGTRVAQHYAKRFPQHTRSLVLDGVVPNTQILGSEHARNLEAALKIQFDRCLAEPACREALGDPRENLDRLATELKQQPRPVRYRDALTGEVREDLLRFDHLAGVLRLYAYMPAMASMLPLILHEAVEGDGALLMAQADMLFESVGGQINHGMQLSVICNEDVPLMRADPDDALTVLGVEFIDLTRAQCEAWPAGERVEGFHDLLQSPVPALLLSGEFDPVTPPRYGEETLAGLPNARHVVLNGQGHNVIGIGCMPKIAARFIETLDAAALDTACLDSLPYTPPFTGFHGWEP